MFFSAFNVKKQDTAKSVLILNLQPAQMPEITKCRQDGNIQSINQLCKIIPLARDSDDQTA